MKKLIFLFILGFTLLSVNTVKAQILTNTTVNFSLQNDNFDIAPCIMYEIFDSGGLKAGEFPGMCYMRGIRDITLGTHRLVNSQSYILRIVYHAVPFAGETITDTVYKIFTPQNGKNVKIILNTNLQIDVMQYSYLSLPID